MHGQIDLAERTPAEHLADPVEGDISHRWQPSQAKRPLELLHHVADLLGAGAELAELALVVEGFLGADNLAVEGFLVDVRCDLSYIVLIIFCNKSPVFVLICHKCLRRSDSMRLIHAVLRSTRPVRLRLALSWDVFLTIAHLILIAWIAI